MGSGLLTSAYKFVKNSKAYNMEWVSKKRKTAINKAHNYGILQRRLDIEVLEILCQFFNVQHNAVRRIDYDRLYIVSNLNGIS